MHGLWTPETILHDSSKKSDNSNYKREKFGWESNIAHTTWEQWKWRFQEEADGRLQTTSFILCITEPENGLRYTVLMSAVLLLKSLYCNRCPLGVSLPAFLSLSTGVF